MPELLDDLPPKRSRTKFDFTQWADGQAWKFVRGVDYTSNTDTFRLHVRRWAKANGMQADVRPIAELDDDGDPKPFGKLGAPAVAVRFSPNGRSGQR